MAAKCESTVDPEALKNRDLIELSEEDADTKCCFCGKYEINDVEWGPMYKLNSVVVHYFCLLLSSGLEQQGEDHEGILGFLEEDILKEVRRGRRLKCKWCKGNVATIGCSGNRCNASFHYTCGYENGALFKFADPFPSYCSKHRPQKTIPKRMDRTCPICISEVDEISKAISLPCCGKCLFHRKCMMHTAKQAGYFFKCPLCNDVKKFVPSMRDSGIFVPEQDAGWETEDAFVDHYSPHSTCDAENCICPKGRKFDDETDRKWNLIRCRVCGSAGTHYRCSNLTSLDWSCGVCSTVFEKQSRRNGNENFEVLRGIADFMELAADYEDVEIWTDDIPHPVATTSSTAIDVQASGTSMSTTAARLREFGEFNQQNPSHFTIEGLKRKKRTTNSLSSVRPGSQRYALRSRLNAMMRTAAQVEVIEIDSD